MCGYSLGKGARTFQGDKNILYPDCGDGYADP